jgi:hypothetical protein
MKTSHRECMEVAEAVLRRRGTTTLAELKNIWRKKGLEPSTFAIWNLANAGKIRRLGKGVYRYTGVMLIAIIALTQLSPAHAQQTRYYDSRGNSLGTSSTSSGGQTRYYDSRGNSLGTSTTRSGTTTLYDARGNVTGRSSTTPSR